MRPVQYSRIVVYIRRDSRTVHSYARDLIALRNCPNGHDEQSPLHERRNCFECSILENVQQHFLIAKAGGICCYLPPDDITRRQYFWWGRYRVLETKFTPKTQTLTLVLDWSECTSWSVNVRCEYRHIGKVIESIMTHRHFRVLGYDNAKREWILLDLETNKETGFSVVCVMPFFVVHRTRDPSAAPKIEATADAYA